MSTSSPSNKDAQAHEVDYDAVIVGAGFGGLGMLHQLKDAGFSAHVFETGDNVGGTWYWNRYPGICCDSESTVYSLAFDKALLAEWEYTSRYPRGHEVLAYLNRFADRNDLRKDISFSTRVASATVDTDAGIWTIKTTDGEEVRCRYFVTAVGCLSAAQMPDIPGAHSFKGKQYHTARWPHEGVDLTGLRVGVIGTGSSGIQVVPELAKEAERLVVFQRTANYSIPSRNRPLTAEEIENIKTNGVALKEEAKHTQTGNLVWPREGSALDVEESERRAVYQEDWDHGGFKLLFGGYEDLVVNEDSNETVAEFVRERIREVVEDPEVAEKLTPRDHAIGTKRPPLDQGYFETFNRPNVELVDIRSAPIEEITEKGIRTSEGEYELDVIVFATGFDTMTGSLAKIDIHNSEGLRLADKWADHPITYLGLSTAGFPNMFVITGPGSPSVLSNMPTSIEQHIEWIRGCLEYARDHGVARIEPTREAEEEWTEHVDEVAKETLLARTKSWYTGANTPGKSFRFIPYIGGVGEYRKRCSEVAEKGYEGFEMQAGNGANADPAAVGSTE
jgi:cation diffusion facilitator CzcD-associated flavoprotein CzcO